jgi:hypothetical protein
MMKPPEKIFVILVILILTGLFLVGCGGAQQDAATAIATAIDKGQSEAESASTPDQLPGTAASSPDPTNQVILPNINVAPYPGSTELPTVKTELKASDPTTVSLASGKPQLVEFFAFW